MQSLPWKNLKTVLNELLVLGEHCAGQNFISAVTFIIKQRMPDMFHVNSYLMSPSRLQNTLNNSNISKSLQHFKMSYRMLSQRGILSNFKPHPVRRIPCNISIYSPAVLRNISPNNGNIF